MRISKARGIGDRDLEALTADALDALHRGAGVSDEGGGVLGGEQEGEADSAVVGHREVADHAGGEQVVFKARVPDARQRGDDPRLQRAGH